MQDTRHKSYTQLVTQGVSIPLFRIAVAGGSFVHYPTTVPTAAVIVVKLPIVVAEGVCSNAETDTELSTHDNIY